MKKVICLVVSILVLTSSVCVVSAAGFSGGMRSESSFSGGGFNSSTTWTHLTYDALNNLCADVNYGLQTGDIVFDCGVTAVTVSWLSSKECYVISGNKSGTRYILVNGSGGLYYAYADEEEEPIVVPSVDMSSTNSILAQIYNQFYEYSYAQNKLLSRVQIDLTATSDYLVSVLNDYFYPLVYNIDANIEDMRANIAKIASSTHNYGLGTVTQLASNWEVLVEIRDLLSTGIPVTGVDIGDVTVSTDLTNVEGYIDTVETKLTNIGSFLQRGLFNPANVSYLSVISNNVDGLEATLSSILTELQNDTSTGGATDLTNVEGYIDQLESKLDVVNSNLRIGSLPALATINSGISTTNKRLNDIYTRLEGIEDAVLDAENTVIDITTDNDAFNIFYVEKTDGTSESVGVVTKDAAKVVGEFLSVFYRLIFADGLENADIIHDFEEVYTVTDSGVSVW